MDPRFELPHDMSSEFPAEGLAVGRLFTVRETAKILGLCLDSVRHHLRSGQLQGVRVGGSWRVPEKVLLVQLGLATLSAGAPPVEVEKETKRRSSKQALSIAHEPERTASLPSEMSRRQMRDLVEQAAAHADLSKRATQRLLAEWDDLLQA